MDIIVIVDGVNLVVVFDFFVWGFFMMVDWVVKFVMILLLFFLVWIWVIVIDKWLLFGILNFKVKFFENVFWFG